MILEQLPIDENSDVVMSRPCLQDESPKATNEISRRLKENSERPRHLPVHCVTPSDEYCHHRFRYRICRLSTCLRYKRQKLSNIVAFTAYKIEHILAEE